MNDFTDLSRLFEKHNVSFVSVTQQIDTSNAAGRMMLNILMSFSQFEREMTADRIRDKIGATKRKGLWTGGPVPLGYKVVDKHLIVDEVTDPIVKFAFERFAETASARDVALEIQRKFGSRNFAYRGHNVQKAAISKHLKNIFANGELNREATVSKMETVQIEGGRSVVRSIEMFNLDVIIAVGYRVNSMMATQFRIWATSVLKEYMLRGMAINRQRDALAAEMDLRLANHEKRLTEVEQRVDFVVQSALPAPEMVFMEGEFLKAHDAIRKIVKAAKKRLILIDN